MTASELTSLGNLPPEKRWRSQTAPVAVVGALIRRTHHGREQFLLIERNGEPYAGQWALVGGKWDFGETLDAAIEREVLEETGLQSRFVALRGVLSERMIPEEEGALGAHFLIMLCDLVVVNGEAQEQAEGAVGWFDRAEIEKLHEGHAIIPSDYVMIAEFSTATIAAPAVEIEMAATLEHPAQLRRFTWLNNEPAQ